jgi:hypothetical protein
MANSYAPQVRTGNDPKFYGNALRFATRLEAEQNVANLADRWMLVVATQVVESDDPPSHTWVDGKLQTLPRVLFSPTGYQTGFGTDRYKHASGLTPEEREAARAGAVVLFKAARKSHPTSPHGTFYRWAKPYGRVFKPRVATADMLRAAGLA